MLTPRRLLHGIKKPYVLIVAFILAYLIPRLYTLHLHGVFIEADSSGYRTYPNHFGFTDDLAKISFTGLSFRPFPINFLYAIIPSDTYRVLFQVACGLAAWLYFIHVSIKKYKSPATTYFFTYIFIFSPGIIYRDLLILPESLSLSIFIFVLTLIIDNKHKSIKGLAVIFICLVLLAIQRPTLWITLLSIAFCLFIIMKYKKVKYYALIAAFIFSSLIGFGYNSNQSTNGWPKYFKTAYPVTKYSFPIGLLVWKDNPLNKEWVSLLEKSGFPSCGKLLTTDSGPWEYSIRVFGNCKDAHVWLLENKYKFWVIQVFTHPKIPLKQIIVDFPRAFVPSPDPFVFDEVTNTSFIPHFPKFEWLRLSKFEGNNYMISNNPIIFWMPVFLYLILRKYKIGMIKLKEIIFGFLLMGILSLGILVNNLIMPSDIFRHNVPLNMSIIFASYWLAIKNKKS